MSPSAGSCRAVLRCCAGCRQAPRRLGSPLPSEGKSQFINFCDDFQVFCCNILHWSLGCPLEPFHSGPVCSKELGAYLSKKGVFPEKIVVGTENLLFSGVEIHILEKMCFLKKTLVGTGKAKKKKFLYCVQGLIYRLRLCADLFFCISVFI